MPMGDQKITLNFNKLQAAVSLAVICSKPQEAEKLDAITEEINFYTVNKLKVKKEETDESEMSIVEHLGDGLVSFNCYNSMQ